MSGCQGKNATLLHGIPQLKPLLKKKNPKDPGGEVNRGLGVHNMMLSHEPWRETHGFCPPASQHLRSFGISFIFQRAEPIESLQLWRFFDHFCPFVELQRKVTHVRNKDHRSNTMGGASRSAALITLPKIIAGPKGKRVRMNIQATGLNTLSFPPYSSF